MQFCSGHIGRDASHIHCNIPSTTWQCQKTVTVGITDEYMEKVCTFYRHLAKRMKAILCKKVGRTSRKMGMGEHGSTIGVPSTNIVCYSSFCIAGIQRNSWWYLPKLLCAPLQDQTDEAISCNCDEQGNYSNQLGCWEECRDLTLLQQ